MILLNLKARRQNRRSAQNGQFGGKRPKCALIYRSKVARAVGVPMHAGCSITFTAPELCATALIDRKPVERAQPEPSAEERESREAKGREHHEKSHVPQRSGLLAENRCQEMPHRRGNCRRGRRGQHSQP